MSDKSPDDKDGLLGLLKKIWVVVAGFIGAITLVYDFYQLWLGDQVTFTYISAGIGTIILVVTLGWVGFSRKTAIQSKTIPMVAPKRERVPRYPLSQRWAARILLSVVLISIIMGSVRIAQYRQSLRDKFVVLITAFNGPEEIYGLHNEIIENLNSVFSDDEQIKIVTVDESISLAQGSEYAQKLGKRRSADIVIWGWYQASENPNVTFHVENLLSSEIAFEKSLTVQSTTSLTELRSFAFQQQIGQQIGTVISFMAGFIEYQTGRYDNALNHFDRAIEDMRAEKLAVPSLFYMYRGSASLSTGKPDQALRDFDTAIQLDSRDVTSYTNRGVAYRLLGQLELAVQDYNTAIEIDPELPGAYNNRAVVYGALGQPDLAIEDLNKVIQITPEFWQGYYNRAMIYDNLGDFEKAIQDLDQAIELCSTCERAWATRGMTYYFLGQFKRAIQDFDKAIRLDSGYAYAYYGRGGVYFKLERYDQAVSDLTTAIQLDPNRATAYLGRGYVYEAMGKTNEAQADFKMYEDLTDQKIP